MFKKLSKKEKFVFVLIVVLCLAGWIWKGSDWLTSDFRWEESEFIDEKDNCFQRYDLNTDVLYFSISYGKTGHRKQDLAVSFSIKSATPVENYFLYFEEGILRRSNHPRAYKVFLELVDTGLFDLAKGLPINIQKRIKEIIQINGPALDI